MEFAIGLCDGQLIDARVSYAERYKVVRPMPATWEKMARDGDHYRLAFDRPDTWSQKYNLVWDSILDLHLFPAKVMQTEWTFYAKQVNHLD